MEFDADELARLAPSERVAYCRRMALTAERLGDDAEGDVKLIYFELSRRWQALATEIELTAAPQSPPPTNR